MDPIEETAADYQANAIKFFTCIGHNSFMRRYGHPLIVLLLYAAIWVVTFVGCDQLGRVYNDFLYDDPNNKNPRIFVYQGFLLITITLLLASWIYFVLYFLKVKCCQVWLFSR